MRVVFTPHAYEPALGGAEYHTRRLAEGLATRGHDVHVVVPNVSDAEAWYEWGHVRGGPAREILGGATVHRIPYLPGRWNLLDRIGDEASRIERARRRYNRHLRSALEPLSPDAIVTLPHAFPNVAATMALRPGASWKAIYAPLLHEEDPSWAMEPITGAVAGADGVIALTSHERDRLVASYGADPERTIVLPPGVDLPAGEPQEQRDPIVLFLGRRTASKRLDVLYAAMRVVWQSVPETRFVVAGPPPARGEDPATAMAGEPRVEVIGRVDDRQRARLIGSARVLASASIIEAFGLTTLEAWAHATPVVVADSPVRRSVVRHDLDGLIAPGHAVGLAEAITALLTDPARARTMGEAGRRRVESDFRWPDIVKHLDDFLQDL